MRVTFFYASLHFYGFYIICFFENVKGSDICYHEHQIFIDTKGSHLYIESVLHIAT